MSAGVFKSLVSEITYGYGEDIYNRLANFTRMYDTTWRNLNQCRRDIRLKVYEVMAVPTLLYGNKAGVVKRRYESRIRSAEMRFLRAANGCTRQDCIRNTCVREELNTFSVDGKPREYRQNGWIM